MSRHRHFVRTVLAVAVCATVLSAVAQAADNTRYVSITGTNANACTLAEPCRTLQRGINQAPAGGEVRILDSGDYGNNATVKKSLMISSNGHTVYLNNPITVDQADAVVALRGLTLNGQGTVPDGISIVAAAAVHIERCVVHGFAQHGIVATAIGAKVFVLDSISRDNGNRGLANFGSGSSLTIDNSRFESNGGQGILVLNGSHVSIHRSITSGNAGNGIHAQGASISVVSTLAVRNGGNGFFSTLDSIMTVESSIADGNLNGLSVSAGGTAQISNSTFINNTASGILNFGSAVGAVETRRNNTVRGNGLNVNGTLTPIAGI